MNVSSPKLPAAIPDELTGRTAIVTGAGRGMGRAVAVRLAAAGASIVVNDLVAESAQATVEQLISGGGKAIAVAGDVADSTAVESLIGRWTDEYGHINNPVNAARVLRRTPVCVMGAARWDTCRKGNG